MLMIADDIQKLGYEVSSEELKTISDDMLWYPKTDKFGEK